MNKVLLDYIQNEGPSEDEIDAFHLGMIRLVNEIDNGELTNSDIPYMKSDVIRLSNKLDQSMNQITELKTKLSEVKLKNSKLNIKLKEFMLLNPKERERIKKEEEYKKLRAEINNLQNKVSFERGQSEVWMTRYNCLRLQVKSGA